MTVDGLATITLLVPETEADRARELIAVRFTEMDTPPGGADTADGWDAP